MRRRASRSWASRCVGGSSDGAGEQRRERVEVHAHADAAAQHRLEGTVPRPQNGSRTTSPGRLKRSMSAWAMAGGRPPR